MNKQSIEPGIQGGTARLSFATLDSGSHPKSAVADFGISKPISDKSEIGRVRNDRHSSLPDAQRAPPLDMDARVKPAHDDGAVCAFV